MNKSYYDLNTFACCILKCIEKMGKRCIAIAAGCSNTNADGVSLYTFPKQQKLRTEWKKTSTENKSWLEWSNKVFCNLQLSFH